MPRFELSLRARGDLVEIGVYGAERWGDEQSARYVSGLHAVFERLVEGRSVGRRCERIRPGLWRIEHVSHVIFFRRVTSGTLIICRVLHRLMLPTLHPIDDDE